MLATRKERKRVTFGRFEFSGFVHGDNHVSVPVSALKKILTTRQVAIHLVCDIEHDGNGEFDRFHQNVEQSKVAEWCDRELRSLAQHVRRPWLLYIDPTTSVISYNPHSNLAYELSPLCETEH